MSTTRPAYCIQVPHSTYPDKPHTSYSREMITIIKSKVKRYFRTFSGCTALLPFALLYLELVLIVEHELRTLLIEGILLCDPIRSYC